MGWWIWGDGWWVLRNGVVGDGWMNTGRWRVWVKMLGWLNDLVRLDEIKLDMIE